MIVRQSAGIFCNYAEDYCVVISSAYGFGWSAGFDRGGDACDTTPIMILGRAGFLVVSQFEVNLYLRG
jgi:hypothetical protein